MIEPGGGPVRQRPRIDHLRPSEADSLRAAFGVLMGSSDPAANYDAWVQAHAQFGQHDSALFLPWHRAFILAFERALGAAVGDTALALPYWDTLALPEIPLLVQDPPLRRERFTDATRPSSYRLPTLAEVRDVLGLPLFVDFGGSAGHGWAGQLAQLHGYAHLWVGPEMGELGTAVRDPLFWFHHANVDRLWVTWQLAHPGADPPGPDTPLPGIPGNWRVGDVLDTGTLGYEYSRTLRAWSDILLTPGQEVSLEFELPPSRGRFELRLSNVWVATGGTSPFSVEFALAPAGDRLGLLSLFGAHPHPGEHRHPGGPLGGRIPLSGMRDGPRDGGFRVQVSCPPAGSRGDMGTAAVTIGSAQLVWIDELN